MAKDLATPAQNPLEAFAAHRQALDMEAGTIDSSTKEWIAGKLAAIMSATTVEELNVLMTATGLTSADSLIGRTLVIEDFSLQESADAFRANSALQKWCIVKAVDADSGEQFIIDGGGDQFVAGLIAMRKLKGFPFTGTLLAVQTGSGHDMHYWRFATK